MSSIWPLCGFFTAGIFRESRQCGQRIGIARALYHDPCFIVFDEATSSLDSETEQRVMETVRDVQKTKTFLIVAHRLSTLKGCDIILQNQGRSGCGQWQFRGDDRSINDAR